VKGYFETMLAEVSVGLTVGIVIAEFPYKVSQKLGKQIALDRGARIRTSNIEIIPTDALASEAWLTKCRYGNRLSIVDCFVHALGKKEDTLILTTDSAFRGLDVKVELFEVL
jgi:predicted nucleic acid-binding protein